MLTFDDGPYPGRTDTVLSALENFYVNGEKVKAAFFEVGFDGSKSMPGEQGLQGSVHEYPDISRMVDDSRHIVGNHTQYHRYFGWPFAPDTIDEVKQEIFLCEGEIRTALGKEPVKLFRVPYVVPYEPKVFIGAKELGYSLVWGQLAGDVFSVGIWPPRAGVPPLKEVKDNTKNKLKKWNTKEQPNKSGGEPCVLIFHDTSPVTYPNITEIIKYLQDEGFVLTDFDDTQLNTQITRH